jgi:hypothetical protein
MISATAMIEASSSGQMGQPAAWIMANNAFPRAFLPLYLCGGFFVVRFRDAFVFGAATLAKPLPHRKFLRRIKIAPRVVFK